MAEIPTVQWNVRPPVGSPPTRVAALLAAPHHAIAIAMMPAQRTWMTARLYDLGAGDGDMLSIATVARQKPVR
jgi:hypothetical protein